MEFGFFDILNMCGGLALFLYGMSLLGNGLEKLSGGRLEKTLEKLTSNIFTSVLLGAVVTAAVQSSSATTVIVVGLVNAGILKFRGAVGVIMGANIGTTVTAHILRLSDISSDNFWMQLIKPTSLAPMVIVVGVILFMSAKKSRQKELAQILIGFGILFTGMFTMEGAVAPLKDLPAFSEMFATLQNPILGVLVGALVTAVIQSSSASVGILQALSSTGAITFSSAFPIIMGQNIGTCITPILASIGATKNAKRTAMVHLYFNIIGTVVFLIGTYSVKAIWGFSFWDDPITRGGIANFHTLFNITVTLLFIPFHKILEKLATWTVRRSDVSDGGDDSTSILDERFLVSPGLALGQAMQAVVFMAKNAALNFSECVRLLDKYDLKAVERIREVENSIDKMEDRLSAYLLKLTERELTETESKRISELLHLTGEFERIGDYSVNIQECAEHLYETNTAFSADALGELRVISDAVAEIIGMAVEAAENGDVGVAVNIEPLEENIDLIEETLKTRHISRLKTGSCTVDAGFPFVEALGNMERIADHCSNIGVYIIGHEGEAQGIDQHAYTRKIHKGETEHYNERFAFYEQKYFDKIK
ncbi:MAG: Na/Pi cotransporter family protein [Oscillospiraceae bacterium]|nr:Na/Pi cotransporter family protein [Oscillospiraceae bacterium]